MAFSLHYSLEMSRNRTSYYQELALPLFGIRGLFLIPAGNTDQDDN
jgi:hypothetical protein